MPEPERRAQDDDSHPRTSEVLLEPVQQERALQFLADAAGDDGEQSEHRGFPGRIAGERFERIGRDVVQAGEQQPQRVQQHYDEQEDGGHEREADQHLAPGRPLADPERCGVLAMYVQQDHHEGDEEHRVCQRQRQDVWQRQRPAGRGRGLSTQSQHVAERDLGRDAGTQEDLEHRHHPPVRRREAGVRIGGKRLGRSEGIGHERVTGYRLRKALGSRPRAASRSPQMRNISLQATGFQSRTWVKDGRIEVLQGMPRVKRNTNARVQNRQLCWIV